MPGLTACKRLVSCRARLVLSGAAKCHLGAAGCHLGVSVVGRQRGWGWQSFAGTICPQSCPVDPSAVTETPLTATQAACATLAVSLGPHRFLQACL